MKTFTPVNDKCLDCGTEVNPYHERQEIAFDLKNDCRRRCGKCIEKIHGRLAVSTSTGAMNHAR